MRSTTLALVALLALAAALPAQTTGVPFLNDFTINGLGSGMSGAPIVLTAGVPAHFKVTAAGVGYWTQMLVSPLPRAFCSMPRPPSPCAIPFTACGGATNQSIDIALAPLPAAPPILSGFTGPAVAAPGVGALNRVPVMPPWLAGLAFSMQALIFDPQCGLPDGLLWTQAHDVLVL